MSSYLEKKQPKFGSTISKEFEFNTAACIKMAIAKTGWKEYELVLASNVKNVDKSGNYVPDPLLAEQFKQTDLKDIKYLISEKEMFVSFYKRLHFRPGKKPDDLDHLTPSVRAMMKTDCQHKLALTFLLKGPEKLVDKLFSQLPPAQAYIHQQVTLLQLMLKNV